MAVGGSVFGRRQHTDLNLDSSVELVFKTDYVPLERMAGGPQLERIKVNTLNPAEELKADREARSERDKSRRDAEAKRAEKLTEAWPKGGEMPKAPDIPALKDRVMPDGKKTGKESTGTGTTGTGSTGTGSTGTGSTGTGSTGTSSTGSTGSGTTGTGTGSTGTGSAGTGSTGRTLAAAQAAPARKPDVVFVPTPPEVVDAMLELAAPRAGELLVDLGCGDGRIVATAASRYGCRGQGYDIDPRRVAEARARVAAAGVQDRVRIEQRDLFEIDLSAADIVMLYLLPHLNARLLPQLSRLKPGARVVSHDFAIDVLVPDRVVQDVLPGTLLCKTCFLYRAPLRLRDAARPVQREWRESAVAI